MDPKNNYGIWKIYANISGDERVIFSDNLELSDDEDWVDIRVSMFFDGTLNNMYNTTSRLEYAKDWQGKKAKAYRERAQEHKGFDTRKDYLDKGDDSYHNDYTNVARLYQYYLKEPTSEIRTGCVYVEGIGTLKDEEDQPNIGGGFGGGDTGIPEKVKMGCKMLAEKIKDLADGNEIKSLSIDVFGFSRGATAARNFMYEITQDKIVAHYEPKSSRFGSMSAFVPEQPAFGKLNQYLTVKYDGKIKVKFAGLFDTVATYWFCKELGIDLLHLDAVKKATDVLHLTAIDERRANFALTDITSKGAKYEKALPGVHCDIGGSYNPIVEDRDRIVYSGNYYRMKDEKRYLIEEGWYSEHNKLECHWAKMKTGTSTLLNSKNKNGIVKGYITAKYKKIQNEYSFIPLHIMKDKAGNGFNQIKFEKKRIDAKFIIPEELNYTSQRLNNYVFKGAKPMVFYTRKELDIAVQCYNLKYNYDHNPAPYSQEHQITVRSSIPNVIRREVQILKQKEAKQTERLKEIEKNKKLEANDYPNEPGLQQKINDHYTIKSLRCKYLHTSHECGSLANWTADIVKIFDPYKESIRTKPSRYIIQG